MGEKIGEICYPGKAAVVNRRIAGHATGNGEMGVMGVMGSMGAVGQMMQRGNS